MEQNYNIKDILQKYPSKEHSLIEILHDIQSRYRFLPKTVLSEVANYTKVGLSKVASVVTFYKAFSLKPRGDTVIKVCMGTSCHVKGADILKEELEKSLGIKVGETTPDGKYSLETVNCVGACAMAPVIIENEMFHGKFKPVDVKKLLGQGEEL